MAENRFHFAPINPLAPDRIAAHFTGGLETFNPAQSAPHFNEIAETLGIQAAKALIFENTINLFRSQQAQPQRGFNDFPRSANGSEMPVLGKSALGFPVFSNLYINGGDYQDNNGNTIGRYPDIRLDAVIMEMEHENHLTTTEIQGGDSTVIEYVGSKSSTIHITCSIQAETAGTYPIQDVTDLAIALNSNKPLIVDAWFLAMRGIYAIVIKKDSIKQEEGMQDSQKFEFDAIADKPLILKLKKA